MFPRPGMLGDGPARRNYSLTRSGHEHLREWAHLLEGVRRGNDRVCQRDQARQRRLQLIADQEASYSERPTMRGRGWSSGGVA